MLSLAAWLVIDLFIPMNGVSGFDIERSAFCLPDFCFNGGTCYTPKGKNQPFCQCPSGYWGSRCQHRAGNKPCSGHVCQNNGICDSDGFTRHGGRRYPYACRCVGKFSGPFCAQSREKVMCMYQKKCGNRATLVVERGQCKCKCKPEYTGRDCEKALPCASVRCEHGTKCDNRNARCNCDGTFYTGKLCDRISVQKLKQHNAENYCSTSRFDCQHGAHCIVANISGRPTEFCNCSAKWNGDRLCTKEFNPCELTAFEKACANREPQCPNDTTVTPERCLNKGTCRKHAPPPGRERDKGFTCSCTKEYFGDFCEIKNPCTKRFACPSGRHLCHVIASTDGSGIQKQCLCNGSYTGAFCERKVKRSALKKICAGNKCKNNSTCIPCIKLPGICKTTEQHKRKYMYHFVLAIIKFCACDLRQSGEFCQHQLNPCRFHTCRNRASCEKVNDYMYKCKCPPGVTGLHCQIILDICELRSPCDLGECVLDKNSRYGYYCICPPDKRGWQCELPKYSFFGLFYMTRTTYVALWTGISSLILAVVLQAISMGQKLLEKGGNGPGKKKNLKTLCETFPKHTMCIEMV
ncbi:hypothetical protein M513_03536 [Trichuris suis]|uniref:EGF-like domain-containing protein n=1 Tax=Trichuris suis TaxID=68888 RepID=A0A085ME38_9BILA|nr:hypothetical protein M513_03536 [Trichuris suis]